MRKPFRADTSSKWVKLLHLFLLAQSPLGKKQKQKVIYVWKHFQIASQYKNMNWDHDLFLLSGLSALKDLLTSSPTCYLCLAFLNCYHHWSVEAYSDAPPLLKRTFSYLCWSWREHKVTALKSLAILMFNCSDNESRWLVPFILPSFLGLKIQYKALDTLGKCSFGQCLKLDICIRSTPSP